MTIVRFASTDQYLDCAELVHGEDTEAAARALAERAVPLVQRAGSVVFRLGRLRLGIEDSRALSRAICEALRRALVAGGAPASMRLEHDRAQSTHVPSGYPTRTLLPHHDGQHCSYLTPSTRDDPSWLPEWREFGRSGYTTTPAHKMYQGVFIADPGEALSVTTYYDWLDLLTTVYAERHRVPAAEVPLRTVAEWLGRNLRAALDRQAKHGSPYPTIGAMLGVEEPMWHGLSFHHAEAELSGEDRERYPMSGPLAKACPCGDCVGDTARLFCHQTLLATGRDWRQFRARWEVCAPSERFDLLFGHNLTMLHGGLAGGGHRVIEPMCLVVDEPSGPEYEDWLAASWRRRLPVGE
ncbi:hypothetical protein C6W10_21775 [Plantactinospora sp. BB1]|nr:hypothetical protein C6W10_21775 [Plantactinospora sp. BB1]